MNKSIALIGPGRVGSTITKFLAQAGYPISAVIGRDQQRAEDACRFIGCSLTVATTELTRCTDADIILLGVPDDQIASVCQTMSDICPPDNKFLIHFSGLLPASTMLNDATNSEHLLSLHPLFPFANREQAYTKLRGCACALEGSSQARAIGQQLVASFSGQAFEITADDKPLYHCAASIASNFLVTLLESAKNMMHLCGIKNEQLSATLMPLIRATLDNIESMPPEQGLTGPIVRGDCGTVACHIQTLMERSQQTTPLYRHLGQETLKLARRSGRLDSEKATLMEALLRKKSSD
jgi:predicted short-subunit dehydrogenase-like oxidoreductase (DUF2520 family)